MIQVTIVDYGMGNLRSVAKACQACGAETELAATAGAVERAPALILPGVGSFADAMGALQRQGLVEPLRRFLVSGRPFLGICLGLHLLFEHGDEGGGAEGLGLIPGRVVRFSEPLGDGKLRLPVPHMGWNRIDPVRADVLLDGVPAGSFAYFLHSFYAVPRAPEQVTLTETPYPDPFCSAVAVGAVRATQFHPEKSQRIGLLILQNFLRLTGN